MRTGLVFLLTLVLVAPALAIAGVAAGGVWAPLGLMAAGSLLIRTGRATLGHVAEAVPSFGGIRLRIQAVVWSVVIVAAILVAASTAWLVWRLVG